MQWNKSRTASKLIKRNSVVEIRDTNKLPTLYKDDSMDYNFVNKTRCNSYLNIDKTMQNFHTYNAHKTKKNRFIRKVHVKQLHNNSLSNINDKLINPIRSLFYWNSNANENSVLNAKPQLSFLLNNLKENFLKNKTIYNKIHQTMKMTDLWP